MAMLPGLRLDGGACSVSTICSACPWLWASGCQQYLPFLPGSLAWRLPAMTMPSWDRSQGREVTGACF